MPPTLGDFSTILQFSLGANITFATVLSLFDNPLSREKRAVEQLERNAEKLSLTSLLDDEREAIVNLKSLRVKVENFSNKLETWTYKWFRPASAVAATAAGWALVVATYYPSDFASIFFQAASLATVGPLVVFSLYALASTTINVSIFEHQRFKIDGTLSGALDRQQPPAAAE